MGDIYACANSAHQTSSPPPTPHPTPGYEAIAHYRKPSHVQWSPLIRTTLGSFHVSCLVRHLIEGFHCMY